MANALDFIQEQFPWLRQLGISPSKLQQWIVDDITGDALLEQVRRQPEYRARFPGIRRPDGTLRASEQQYLATVDNYRQVLRQFGEPEQLYDDPQDFAALFEAEIDPNELNDRLTIFDRLETSSQDIKDAFFVYGGINLTTEDLYRALQSGPEADRLVRQYNEAVTNSPLDYETWISRATEASLRRVTTDLQRLEREGAPVGRALASIRNLDPQFARQMTDVLLHGGNPQDQQGFLSLNELTRAFEFALIGSAASEQGFRLPTQERLSAFRNAGVDRAAALRAYSAFAQSGNSLQAAVRRLRRDATLDFTVEDFENATFLQDADTQRLLTQAQAREDALGRSSSGAGGFSRSRTGLLQQEGFAAV